MPQSATPEVAPLVHTFQRGVGQETSLTLPRDPEAEGHGSLETLTDSLPAGSYLLRADVFGPPAPLNLPCPITWVCPSGPQAEHLGGVYLQAITEAQVTPIRLDGRLVGSVVETADAIEFIGAGIGPADASVSAPRQARQTFERMEQALELAGMDFSHVVRTWLFLDDILAWYDDFNPVRTDFFKERGVFERMVPASTGIGGPNPYGWAMMTGLWAVKPKSQRVFAQALPSPLQCPALEYGSSFSRAAEVDLGDHRHLTVSGTASIAPGGETVYVGDVARQIERTMEVVEAILTSRDMTWADTTRATAYLRYPQDVVVFESYRRQHGLESLPVLTVHNTICRDNLLFELELDAVAAR